MQKDVIIDCVQKGLEFKEIQNKLSQQFGEQAIKRSAIYKYIQEAKLENSQEEELTCNENRNDEELLVKIQYKIAKNEFFGLFTCT